MNFADRLKQLPSASHLAALHLLGADGQVLATLENKPGQAGSLAVYAALAALYGGHITPAAAQLGLEWYAEHTQDALAHPGSNDALHHSAQQADHTVKHDGGHLRIGHHVHHQLVYAALKGRMGGELHALALETSAPA